MDSVASVVTWVFMAANMGRLLAYIPQIHAAATCRNGATSVSRMTWGYFGVAHLAGAVYGGVVVHDTKMVIVFMSNFLACATVVSLVTWKKRAYIRALSEQSAPAPSAKPTAAQMPTDSALPASMPAASCSPGRPHCSDGPMA